jgi:hypothetical protein
MCQTDMSTDQQDLQTYKKLELAERQLETAIGLFVSRRDRISAITLAGAADGILHGLVLEAKKEPFADYARGIREAISNQTPSKAKYAKHINDQLNINDLKHMDEGDPDEISFDIAKSALGAIMKAIANHGILVEEKPDYVNAMLHWAWLFYDGEKIREDETLEKPAGEKLMEWYGNVPDKVKRKNMEWAKDFQAKLNSGSTSGE